MYHSKIIIGPMDNDISRWAETNRKRLKLSQHDIGRALGISQPQARSRLIGEMEFSVSEIQKLSAMFDESAPVDIPSLPDFDFNLVPEYDVTVSAGGGAIIEHENVRQQWPFNPAYLENELRVSADRLAMVEVRGDSMEPTLSSGDRVLVNLGDVNVSQPGIFVLYDGSGTVIKRIERVYDAERETIALISDNERHRRYEIVLDGDHIKVVGRVIWAAKRF